MHFYRCLFVYWGYLVQHILKSCFNFYLRETTVSQTKIENVLCAKIINTVMKNDIKHPETIWETQKSVLKY